MCTQIECDTNGPLTHTLTGIAVGGSGVPRTNWRSTVNKDLLRMGITWEEAEVAAQNRSE